MKTIAVISVAIGLSTALLSLFTGDYATAAWAFTAACWAGNAFCQYMIHQP